MNSPTPAEIAKEAREALARIKETPQETWARLIRLGWINSKGEVTKIFGGDADPEPGSDAALDVSGNGHLSSERRRVVLQWETRPAYSATLAPAVMRRLLA